MRELFWLPELASEHGVGVDNLIYYVHYLMLVLFIGWGFFFVYALFRFRKSKNPKANYEGLKGHFTTYHEGAIAFLEIILLFALSLPLYADSIEGFPQENESTLIRVVAEQFAWSIHYPGTDKKFGKTDPKFVHPTDNPLGIDKSDPNAKDDFMTINQLHLPVNKPVIAKITSKDVIHSFKLPEMRITQDAIPGQEIAITFKPIKEGKWDIACAQLCGVGHTKMRGFLTIESQEVFDKWFTETSSTAQNAGSDDEW